MLQIEVNGYSRISKAEARRRFADGKETYVVPHKVVPGSVWTISPNVLSPAYGDSFETWMNAFDYYNCNYKVGYYAAYYVKC